MDRCIFCRIVAGELDKSAVFEDERFLVFLDVHPMRPGHLLVIPKRHCQRVTELSGEEAGALFQLGAQVAAALRRSDIPCEDVHFLINDGAAANQTVPHIHLHVVPRTGRDLGRVLLQLATRPVVALLPASSRRSLNQQAAQIRAAMA